MITIFTYCIIIPGFQLHSHKQSLHISSTTVHGLIITSHYKLLWTKLAAAGSQASAKLRSKLKRNCISGPISVAFSMLIKCGKLLQGTVGRLPYRRHDIHLLKTQKTCYVGLRLQRIYYDMHIIICLRRTICTLVVYIKRRYILFTN